MTTRSNTIVRPGGLLRWALCLAALVSLLPLRAADDAPARKVAGELAARFRAMKAYTVTFAVEGDDFAAEGSYAVEGDRYYMRVGDAEAYCDGVSKWEVDPSKREVVVDVVDTQSRSLLGNPTRAFDFLDDAFRSELLPSEGEVRRLRLTPVDKGAAMSSITVDVAADGSHPSYAGSYLAAAVICTTLTGAPFGAAPSDGLLDPDTAAYLRRVAEQTVLGRD